MGATRRQIVTVVLSGSERIVMVTCALGIMLFLVFARFQDRLFDLRLPAGASWIVPAVVGLLAAATLAACWRPVQRALNIVPTEALGFE